MSIQISNLDQANLLVDLNAADSAMVIGGTSKTALSPYMASVIPTVPNSVQTLSSSTVGGSPNAAYGATVQIAAAQGYGPGTTATQASAFAGVDRNGALNVGGGALGVAGANLTRRPAARKH
jgi:hypothetical protein